MTIHGNYIDSQIYRGRLYLWKFDGTLEVFDWDRLVENTQAYLQNKLLMRISFLEGNLLYKKGVHDLLADVDFKKLIREKLIDFSSDSISIDERVLEGALISKQSFPGNEEPIDTAIYSSKLYFASDTGLYKCEVHKPKRAKSQVTNLQKIWDCRLFSIDTSKYGQLALCGGDDGLFELNNTPAKYRSMGPVNYTTNHLSSNGSYEPIRYDPIYRISKKHSTFAHYSFSSIYSSSVIDSSYLSVFDWVDSSNSSRSMRIRKQCCDIKQNEIFGTANGLYISWGSQEKIYLVTNNSIRIMRIKKTKEQPTINSLFDQSKEISIQPWKGDLVSAGISYFGIILEYENALVVLLSGGESLTIPGRSTKWRVFPRSYNYENQLHVIQDDHITIYSYYNDYFIEQKSKDFGVEYQDNVTYSSMRYR
jgi:hypothetical protein